MVDIFNKPEFYSIEKPGRYFGGECNISLKKNVELNFLLAFPDIYEVGMSSPGYIIIYHLLNSLKNVSCERVFAPQEDMEVFLRRNSLELFSLESKKLPLEFDVIGFSISYEMQYTNLLNMIDLFKFPLFSSQRDENFPLILAGGYTTCNPEPISLFIDVFIVGEGEEILPKICMFLIEAKKSKLGKNSILNFLSNIDGVYIPTLKTKKIIKKCFIKNFEKSFYPLKPIIPNIEIIHNRATIEISRGCPHQCKFCQARSVYYPYRERKFEDVISISEKTFAETGYEEISLLSLSATDYHRIKELIKHILEKYKRKRISVSLPSLRVNKFSIEIADLLHNIRKTSLTFAIEAGSQRLRDFIKKKISEDDIISTVFSAITSGWDRMKFYFMIGLPTETEDDLRGIVDICEKVCKLGDKKLGKILRLHISVSNFIPKPHTPFQWYKQENQETLMEKQRYLKSKCSKLHIISDFHNVNQSLVESVLSRGDKRLGKVIYNAFRKGSRFDGWDNKFNIKIWESAFMEEGLDIDSFISESYQLEEELPWDFIDVGVSKETLKKEYSNTV